MNQEIDTQNKAFTHVKQSLIKKLVFAAIVLVVIVIGVIGFNKFISFDNKTTKMGGAYKWNSCELTREGSTEGD